MKWIKTKKGYAIAIIAIAAMEFVFGIVLSRILGHWLPMLIGMIFFALSLMSCIIEKVDSIVITMVVAGAACVIGAIISWVLWNMTPIFVGGVFLIIPALASYIGMIKCDDDKPNENNYPMVFCYISRPYGISFFGHFVLIKKKVPFLGTFFVERFIA